MTKPISPLRQRMIDDMTMRNFSANTQETYIRSVAQFSAFHRRSPDKLGVEHVRDFHLHLVSRGLVANSIAVKMAALRFFYGTTLRRPDIAAEIPTPRRPDHLPAVLARAEVERLLKAVGDLKLRTALMTIYSAGLRISEAMRLTAQDIDSARMVICVRQGKGRKDRYTVLSGQLLGILRDYWQATRPSHWLFPGRIPSTLAPTSASPLCCTLGARTSSTIRMCIASCRVADYRRTASAGSPVRTASFFRSACSRACFAACSCKLSKPCTPPTNCSSSPISASLNTPTPGELTSRRCARANGSSMPKSPSPVLCRSWPISRAIR